MNNQLRILDLFAGIGGFSKAFENVDPNRFKTHAFCEIDKHAQKVLRSHWPITPIFENVKKLDGNIFRGRIEIICGGFPCQDISIGGNGQGIKEGTRSGLWKEYWRLINEIRPKYVIIENVSELRNNGLGVVLNDLSKIGYDSEWNCITADSVGLPHQRDRLFIISYPRWPAI